MARRVGVTREQVVEAAGDLADREGMQALSLTAVAGALGIRTPSMYAHVPGLEGLRRAVAMEAATRFAGLLAAGAHAETEPEDRVRACARAYRSFARQHPGRYASLLPVARAADDPEAAAAAAQPVAVLAEVLSELGIPAARHVDLIRAVRSALHGFAALENGGGFGLADPVDASFEVMVELLVAGLTLRNDEERRGRPSTGPSPEPLVRPATPVADAVAGSVRPPPEAERRSRCCPLHD